MASRVLSACDEFTSSDPLKQRLGSMWSGIPASQARFPELTGTGAFQQSLEGRMRLKSFQVGIKRRLFSAVALAKCLFQEPHGLLRYSLGCLRFRHPLHRQSGHASAGIERCPDVAFSL